MYSLWRCMLEQHKLAEIEEHERSLREDPAPNLRKPFGPEWGISYWVKWATIVEALTRLGIAPGARVLDVGCGVGWSTVFLAEAGYRCVGVDMSEPSLGIANQRAARWQVPATFKAADMDDFALDEHFDAALVFDALHHSRRHPEAVVSIARHLNPGGWAIFGEPSWLHYISPHARRASKELGWTERGVLVRALKRHCQAAGLTTFRRFFEGTRPYESRGSEFVWQLVRLVAANFAVAPQASVWLAAQKPA